MRNPNPTPRPGGRTERHTRSIIDNTLRLLETQGYAALSFSDIASASGVSRSTLHRRWSSRAELVLDAIVTSVAEKITAPDLGSLRADLKGMLRSVGDYISTPLGSAVLVASLELELSPGQDRPGRWATRIADFDPMFDRAIQRGEIPANFDRDAALALASGALYYRRITASGPLDDEWIERVFDAWGSPPP